MQDIALSFFASACGKNRGAFVLDPPDGQTYGWYVLFLMVVVAMLTNFCIRLQLPFNFFNSGIFFC